MKKTLWKILGFILLGLAYIGVVTPGIPFSPFLVGSAYAFSKGSPRMHTWIYNHKQFGPFLNNWVNMKVFPTKMKYMMLLVMSSSLVAIWFTSHNLHAIFGSGSVMLLVAIWAWRFPGSIDEYIFRTINNKKIGWLK
jgi:uncharacterized membrane protein YbaN (DUF454 family)